MIVWFRHLILKSNYGEVQNLIRSYSNSNGKYPSNCENEPHFELKRFEEELSAVIPNGVFDWIILGMGIDGHTVFFPYQTNFDDETELSLLHPSGQICISKTAKLIEQAFKRITYLVTGES